MKPSDPRAHVGLGWCYLDLERNAEALSSFHAAVQARPDYAEAYFGMAEVHAERGDLVEAARLCRKYLEIDPTGADAALARRCVSRATAGRKQP